ncbi:MAG: hypothetical protein AAGE65_07505 [Planctomycetota bacterium]
MPRTQFGPARFSFRRASAVLALSLSAAGASATQVTANLNDRAQTIDGFGTALPWFMDNAFANPRSGYNTDAFADLFFDDLGASMARMELQYTVLTETGTLNPTNAQMETPVVLGSDTYANIAKFNFDAAGVGHLKQFFRDEAPRQDFKLIGSLWSPPHWMKGPEIHPINGSVVNESKPTWGATANSAGGSLIDTPENLQQFGRYITAWLKGWEQQTGVPYYAISIQNEPVLSEFYNSAVYDPALYVKALKAVDAAIAEHNAAYPNDRIETKLHGPEGVGVGPQGDLGILWRQFQFIDAVRNDPQANAALDIWSTHGADGTNGRYRVNLDDPSANAGQHWEFWNAGRTTTDPATAWAQWQGVGPDAGETRPTWQTERSGDVNQWLSGARDDQNGALSLGVRMHDALATGDVSAYLYWFTQYTDGRPLDTFELTINEETDRPKYVAYKHFAKHIRPGAERVEVDSDDPQLLVSAYHHEGDGTLTYVLLNVDDDADAVTLDLPDGFDAASVAAWLSRDGSYYEPQSFAIVDGAVDVLLPRESMLTLVFSSLASALIGDFDGSGQVEQGDLNLVLNNWGQAGTPDGWVGGGPDGVVDQAELNAVLNNWGSVSSPDLTGLSSVPEPAWLSALVVGAAVGRRRPTRVHA